VPINKKNTKCLFKVSAGCFRVVVRLLQSLSGLWLGLGFVSARCFRIVVRVYLLYGDVFARDVDG
jgi:hypothetical protein